MSRVAWLPVQLVEEEVCAGPGLSALDVVVYDEAAVELAVLRGPGLQPQVAVVLAQRLVAPAPSIGQVSRVTTLQLYLPLFQLSLALTPPLELMQATTKSSPILASWDSAMAA